MSEQPGSFVLDITAKNGVPFRVVFYLPGAVGPFPAAKEDERPTVEFYDRRYPHTEHGQFTGGRYFLSTIFPGDQGVWLHGGVDAWTVDGASMLVVRAWWRHLIDRVLMPGHADQRYPLTAEDLAVFATER